jgi:AcrR family transcriptional regulator
MAPTPAQRRAARHQQSSPDAAPPATRNGPRRQQPITVDLLVNTAFEIISRDGYEALSMRRLATALGTGPASLYAHVVNKEDLDDLLIGRVCAKIELPEPDPERWQEQITIVCTRLCAEYLKYPGLSRASMAAAPTNLETLRVSEGLLAILLAGGIDPQTAAWAIDAIVLYLNAYCLEIAEYERRRGSDDDNWVVSQEELLRRFAALPDSFPNTKRYAAELTSGKGNDRFDFTLRLIINGLTGRLRDRADQ